MKVETILNCPLGHKCQEIKDDKIYQCAWYVKLAGLNPNTGEEIDEYACAIYWNPILMIENSRQQKSTSAAVESFRNEMVKSNDNYQKILLNNLSNNDKKLIDIDI